MELIENKKVLNLYKHNFSEEEIADIMKYTTDYERQQIEYIQYPEDLYKLTISRKAMTPEEMAEDIRTNKAAIDIANNGFGCIGFIIKMVVYFMLGCIGLGVISSALNFLFG